MNIRAFLIDNEDHIDQASRALKAMAHPLRLKILCVLGCCTPSAGIYTISES